MRKNLMIVAAAVIAAGGIVAWPAIARWEDPKKEPPVADRLAKLEAVASGQGTLMSLLGYHFGNLWFALDKENWALAEFFVTKCRESLEQAVAAEPIKKLPSGKVMPLRGMADSLDKTQLAEMIKAIGQKDKAKALASYRDAMMVCTSCHMMSGKPFLRLRVPDAPPSSVIAFDALGHKAGAP